VILNLILWIGGAALLILGVVQIRAPLARANELKQLEDNARRYDAWRGGSRTAASRPTGGRSGADEMQEMLRTRVRIWAAAIVVGVVMIVAGFLIK
jgi:nucleoside recognition membrane protein YjiH